MSAWQPIGTAPRDGTHVILGEYCDWQERWVFWEDWWRKYLEPYGEGFGHARKPTHWHSLPDPPA